MSTPIEQSRLALRDHVRTADTNRTGHVIALSVLHQMALVQFSNGDEERWVSLALLEPIEAETRGQEGRYADVRDVLPTLARPSWVSRSSSHAPSARWA
jgi:hypothetical protein